MSITIRKSGSRKALCERFNASWEVPPEMIGSLASLPILPLEDEPARANRRFDPIQDRLYHQYGVEVPIISWPSSGHRLVRISRQAYNTEADYERLGDAVAESFLFPDTSMGGRT